MGRVWIGLKYGDWKSENGKSLCSSNDKRLLSLFKQVVLKTINKKVKEAKSIDKTWGIICKLELQRLIQTLNLLITDEK